jgi:hypothetical protein
VPCRDSVFPFGEAAGARGLSCYRLGEVDRVRYGLLLFSICRTSRWGTSLLGLFALHEVGAFVESQACTGCFSRLVFSRRPLDFGERFPDNRFKGEVVSILIF